jgi:hypothetical protein
MDALVLMPVVVIIAVVACILIPIWLRQRLYHKQLDVVAKVIERGVDPAAIKHSLTLPSPRGDVNGNWKAGVILIGLGLGLFVLGLPQALNEAEWGWLMTLLIALLGVLLLVIHSRIVGHVVPVGAEESRSTDRTEA